MASPRPHPPALLIVAMFSRFAAALDWSQQQIESRWGSIIASSQDFDHDETRYYEAEMGIGLKKRFVVIEGCFDPQRLPACKLESNRWEDELAASRCFDASRPVNLDPGYLTLTKLVLASAKDRAHRLYMADGIYAEECLYYLDRSWQPRPWTYPDYCRADYHRFFDHVRQLLKAQPAARPQVGGRPGRCG